MQSMHVNDKVVMVNQLNQLLHILILQFLWMEAGRQAFAFSKVMLHQKFE